MLKDTLGCENVDSDSVLEWFVTDCTKPSQFSDSDRKWNGS
jgi:hypothetical protein